MPSNTIDTFLSCSIMIILAVSAMAGTSKLMAPYLADLSHQDDSERLQQLTYYILLNAGTPPNWGQIRDLVPSTLGLARAGSSLPYELDIDKVSRLNNEDRYALTYRDLWTALGAKDTSFQIEIRPLFQVLVTLISNSTLGDQTVYDFDASTQKSGMPLATNLSMYIAIGNFVNRTTSETNSNGTSSFRVTIPNSLNGTALLLVFAKAKVNPQIVSYNVYAFGHNSPAPSSNGTFLRLSPLNYVLNASLSYPAEEIGMTETFTFNYNSTLTDKARNTQTREYWIPHLLDSSPMITVLTGTNGSSSFAEWSTYPQVPLVIGEDFNQSVAGSQIVSQSHIVTINSALYEAVTAWGGLNDNV